MPHSAGPHLATLSDDQRERLLRRVRATRAAQPTDRIPPARRDEPLPLSAAQQSVWLLSQWSEGDTTYNTPLALRVRGGFDADLLRRALGTVVDRHEVLRTTYEQGPDGPRQVVHAAPPDDLVLVTEVPGLGPDERDAFAREQAQAEARRPIDLRTGPVLRASLVRFAADDHLLVLAMHHIATDAWSTGLLVRELTECYTAARDGRAPELAALPIQYADFARWQRDREGTPGLTYWREELAGLPELDFPADRAAPAAPTGAGAVASTLLPADLHRRIQKFATSAGTRVLPVVTAAYAALLTALTGQDDIPLGTVFSGRDRTEIEPLIGFFATTAVLRLRTAGDPAFRDLVDHAQAVLSRAHAHQDVPFEQVVAALAPPRRPGRNPLFQVALHSAEPRPAHLTMGDAELVPVESHAGQARFDCTIAVAERPDAGGIELSAEYATDMFDADRMNRLLAHLVRLLESAMDDPDTPIGALDLLAADERDRLVSGENDTATPLPPGTLLDAFAARVAAAPDAPALSHRGTTLDYAELDRRANRLAHRLRRLGVGPGDLVGVCLHRSPDLIVGLLAVLKAGAAYVPLDPGYPAARLELVLDSAEPLAVLVDAHSRASIPPTAAAVVDLSAREPAGLPDTAPESGVREHDLAYVIYTSGSTGRPKGVQVEHAQLTNLFTALDRRFGADGAGTWLAVTSVSFDISVLELFWTLTRGWHVVVADGRADELLGAGAEATRTLDLSLFYFASDDGDADGYRLLLDGAKFADQHGFAAVWTPERHFQPFGGRFPSPAVTAAALSTVTERVALRAGSVVLPLNHPVRVAEEWSVIDNLSGGRAGIAFASGWAPQDFVFAPNDFAERRKVLLEAMDTVRGLWRGEARTMPGGTGDVEVRTRPRPVQPELPAWLTSGGSPDTFRAAAEQGVGVLTHLLGQDVAKLGELIALYRRTWRETHGSDGGTVTLMLHTFVGADADEVLRTVREPFIQYLRGSLDLLRPLAAEQGLDPADLSGDDLDAVLEHAFHRYVHSSALIGTPEHCLEVLGRLTAIGVDEVACLIDFGVPTDEVLASLPALDAVRQAAAAPPADRVPTLRELIARHGVTHLQCTPALAELMADDKPTRVALGGLRRMLVGGEALPAPLAGRLRTALDGGDLVNMYGPTETTVWSAAADVRHEDTTGTGTVCLGTPLSNTSLHVLDRWGRPQPAGVPGELFIGGAGVTRGYHGQPGLTADRFVPDPFAPDGRLYRTGDLVRRTREGLEFLGRTDHQVKVRGFRIELSEVEAVLRAHPDVASVVVVAGGPPAARFLAAHVIGVEGRARDAAALAAYCRERLPEHMVPARWQWLDTFPLTPNGKVDRQSLPPLDAPAAGAGEAPRTARERAIAEVWAQTLDLPIASIGVRDNFFALGGHSVTVLRALTVAAARGLRLTVRQMFTHQTVEELARATAETPTDLPDGVVEVAAGSGPALFCLHSSTGTAVPYLPLAGHLGVDRACFAIEAAPVEAGAAVVGVPDLARRAVDLIVRVQPTGPYHLAGWSLGGGLAWAVATRLQELGHEVASLTMMDTHPPTALAEAPDHATAVRAFTDTVCRSQGREPLPLTFDVAATDEERFAAAADALEAAGLVLAADRSGVLSRARTFTSLLTAAATWTPGPVHGPVDLLVAAEPGDISAAAAGWGRWTAELRTRLTPGDHFGLLQPAHVGALGATLEEIMG
ncbi:MupA/Atu3671 family FMN-dependent luciferase-like monooxygenase [Actinoplanes sp. NPDC051859]|uniref:MupA/Atu3671 family FMN-dependent luciferase-like monooxygenase n=1 Tax=Actinoplanes sp. NPDC051859 TaxID=3363909 RepID=UPI0037A2ABCD